MDVLILKVICCLSEIQIELGMLHFIWNSKLKGRWKGGALTPGRALHEMPGENALQSLGKLTVCRSLLVSVFLSGTFLFSRLLKASLSFEVHHWSLFSHMDKQVLNDVSFTLTSKTLFYYCIWFKGNIQCFSNLGIPGTFPPPAPPNIFSYRHRLQLQKL